MHEEVAEAEQTGRADPQTCLEHILSGHLEPRVGEERTEGRRENV